jgi:hypothetical protein
LVLRLRGGFWTFHYRVNSTSLHFQYVGSHSIILTCYCAILI